jgi:hypothetical protein
MGREGAELGARLASILAATRCYCILMKIERERNLRWFLSISDKDPHRASQYKA